MLLRSQVYVPSQFALLPRSWVAGSLQVRHAITPAPGSIPEPSTSREFPDEPRVGVGVVILRNLQIPSSPGPEVVLIKRGKPPDLGKWSFPGGSLELGETMAECAIREAAEETGLRLRNDASQATCSRGELLLAQPHPFTAADVIRRDPAGRIKYHYAIVEVAAMPQDHHQAPRASADADDARWVPISELEGMPGLSVNIAKVALEAEGKFFPRRTPL